jgi:hypothetical protein
MTYIYPARMTRRQVLARTVFGSVISALDPERIDSHLGEAERSPRLSLAGTAGPAFGSPKSTCSQRNALASSVRMPVARHRKDDVRVHPGAVSGCQQCGRPIQAEALARVSALCASPCYHLAQLFPR